MILLYNEPDRGGIETEHSKIHLGVVGRQKKHGLFAFILTSQTTKASFRVVELVYFKLQKENAGMPSLSQGPRRGKGVHYEKGVTSQVLRGQRNERMFQGKCLCTR